MEPASCRLHSIGKKMTARPSGSPRPCRRRNTAFQCLRLCLPVAVVVLSSIPWTGANGSAGEMRGAISVQKIQDLSVVRSQAFTGTFNGPTFGTLGLRRAGIAALLNKIPKLEVPKIEMPKPSLQGACNFAAGGIAGAVASAITCPLEVVKTNLQSRANVGSGLNPLSMASRIVSEQGPNGLYRGLSLSLLGIIPTRSCYFWTYGATKEALTGVIGDCPVTHMVSAVAAGGLSATVTCPLWMIKTRMQLQGTSLVDTAKTVVAQHGIRGLYRGLKASYWGLTEGALQLLMYEKVKQCMKEYNKGEDLTSVQYLLASGATKGLASMATYPHEVVRTRMREASSSRYQGMLQSLALISREEGRRGLYSGLGPHLLRVVPNTAIMFMSFELLSKHLPKVIEDGRMKAEIGRISREIIEGPLRYSSTLHHRLQTELQTIQIHAAAWQHAHLPAERGWWRKRE